MPPVEGGEGGEGIEGEVEMPSTTLQKDVLEALVNKVQTLSADPEGTEKLEAFKATIMAKVDSNEPISLEDIEMETGAPEGAEGEGAPPVDGPPAPEGEAPAEGEAPDFGGSDDEILADDIESIQRHQASDQVGDKSNVRPKPGAKK